jgi:hypothetical protein
LGRTLTLDWNIGKNYSALDWKPRVSDKKKIILVSSAVSLAAFMLFNFRAGYLERLFDPDRGLELVRMQSFWLNEFVFAGISGFAWFILYRSMASRDR